MADKLELMLETEQPLVIDGISGISLMLRGDVDVWPRDVSFDVALPSEIDRQHFQDTKLQQGWDGDLTMSPTIESGKLVWIATHGRWLPRGRYQLRLTVAGLGESGVSTVDVEDGLGTARATLSFKKDQRRVKLTADVGVWDSLVKGLVMRPSSVIDGRQAADWIRDDSVSPQRRACVLNLLAKLRTIPSVNAPLISGIDRILCAQLERMYVAVSPGMPALAPFRDANIFKDEGNPVDNMHAMLLTWVKVRMQNPESPISEFLLRSYRQAVTFRSMQMVFALPKPSNGTTPHSPYADVDIDLGGALTDVVGFFVHMRELVSSSITNHLDLHKGLSAEPLTQNYLYYDVV